MTFTTELKPISKVTGMDPDFWRTHLSTPCVLPKLMTRPFQGIRDTSGRYFDESIHQYIQHSLMDETYTELEWNGCHILFTFVHTKACPKKIQFFLWFFMKMLQGLTRICPLKRHLHMILMDTPFKKRHTTHVLTPKEVNSGVTVKYMQTNACEVYVYRSEEMCKVLIHELIHTLDIDNHQLSRSLEVRMKRFFGIRGSSLHINEAFTDAFACYLNALVYSVLQGGQRTRANIDRERNFILQQAHHVLSLYGEWHNGTWNPRNKYIRERTHAIAYYILKGVLWSDMDTWFTYMKANGMKLRDEQGFIYLLHTSLFNEQSRFWKSMRRRATNVLDGSLRMSCLDVTNLASKSKLLKTLSTH